MPPPPPRPPRPRADAQTQFAALREQQLLDPQITQPAGFNGPHPPPRPVEPEARAPYVPLSQQQQQQQQKLPEMTAAGAWDKLKSWGLSGLTPADEQYRTAFEKERDAAAAAEPAAAEPVVEAPTDRAGADDLVKAKGSSSGGMLSGVKGWWSGK